MEQNQLRDPGSSNSHTVDDSSSSSRFRFKAKDDLNEHKKRRRHHHPRHSKRRKTTYTDNVGNPSVFENSFNKLSPSQAFRESLFDALGDDEGATFWEGVYGQPIHNYPNAYRDEATGELETMNDEEYAQFVRRKMWEKSREGIEAAMEERRRERAKQKQRTDADEKRSNNSAQSKSDDLLFDFELEASLRRGMERKDRKKWKQLWKEYLEKWTALQKLSRNRNSAEEDTEQLFLRNKIAWPVRSGKRKDLGANEIESFITNGTEGSYSGNNHDNLVQALKIERLRWHPDKIQQRYGFLNIDDGTLKGVTAVFQTFDQMWNNLKKVDS